MALLSISPGRPRAPGQGGRRLKFQAEVNIDRAVFTLQPDSSWLPSSLGGQGDSGKEARRWRLGEEDVGKVTSGPGVLLLALLIAGLGQRAWDISS